MTLPSPVNVQRHQRKISSTTEFKELTKKDSINQISIELDKLGLTARSSQEREAFMGDMGGFKELYRKFIIGSGPIQWEKIQPLPEGAVQDYKLLNQPSKELVKDMLNKLVVVKLNGGLGMCSCTSNSMSLIWLPLFQVHRWGALVPSR